MSVFLSSLPSPSPSSASPELPCAIINLLLILDQSCLKLFSVSTLFKSNDFTGFVSKILSNLNVFFCALDIIFEPVKFNFMLLASSVISLVDFI